MHERAQHRGFTATDVVCLLGLAAATVVVLGKDISSGALADADSAAHLMDGVLIHDWVMAGPAAWLEPMEFARQQYAHYPTLGIGQHYPPGFAVVEAGFFAVFGINAAAARLCVLFFGLLMAAGTYFFTRFLSGPAVAALAAVVLMTLPATTLWGRQTMLEVPTMASLVWAAVTYQWYGCKPTHRRLALAIGAALSTILFKQTAVFLVCAIACAIGIGALRRTIPLWHAVVACVLAAAALGGVVFSFDDACFKTLSGYSTYSDPLSAGALTFYACALPYLAGSLILIPALLGAITCVRRNSGLGVLMLCWLGIAYVMVTSASLKVPRFFYVGLLPLAVWSALGTERVLALLPIRRLHTAVPLVCCMALAAVGFARPVKDAPDYGPIVAAHRHEIENRAVLFSGLRDGDFVFAVRQHAPWRSSIVIRGSKLLYTCTAGPDLDLVSYVPDDHALRELMRRYAFELLFVERENVVGTSEDDMLRAYVASGADYRLATSHGLGPRRPCGLAQTVDVYKLRQPIMRSADYFDIPMPRTGRPIRVLLNSSTQSPGPT